MTAPVQPLDQRLSNTVSELQQRMDINLKGRRSPGLGGPHEQHTSTGTGDGKQRADLQLTASMTQQFATLQATILCCFYFTLKV